MVPFGESFIFHPGVQPSSYPFVLATPDQEIIQYNQLLAFAMSCDVLAFNSSNPEMGSSFEDLVSFIREDCGFSFSSIAIIPAYRREFISKFADMMRGMDENDREVYTGIQTFNDHLRSMAVKVIPFPIAKEDDLPDIFYAVLFAKDGGDTYISHPDDLDVDFGSALAQSIIVQATPEQSSLNEVQLQQFMVKYLNSVHRQSPTLDDAVRKNCIRALKGHYDSVAVVSRWAYGRLRQTARICNQLRLESPSVRTAAEAAFVRELRYCASKVFDFTP
jgi:hypothetical protein